MRLNYIVFCLLVNVLTGVYGHGQTSVPEPFPKYFKDDPVSVDLEKTIYIPGKPVVITFRAQGLDRKYFSTSLRISNSISDTSYRYRVNKLRKQIPDSIDIGTAIKPGLYEVLIEKIMPRTLKIVAPHGEQLSADTIIRWYNFFVYNDTSQQPIRYAGFEERSTPQLKNSWVIIDSFTRKIKADSFNKRFDDSLNHSPDTMNVCPNGSCSQFTIIINNGTDPLYQLNAVTIISDKGPVTDTATASYYINSLSGILLDTTGRFTDTITLSRSHKKLLRAELEKRNGEYTIIKTKEFTQKFMSDYADVDLRYWTQKIYVATIQRKYFRQIIFVVKTVK